MAVHCQAGSSGQTFCEEDPWRGEIVFAADLKVLVVLAAVQKHELAGILQLLVLWEFPLNLFLLVALPLPTLPGWSKGFQALLRIAGSSKICATL